MASRIQGITVEIGGDTTKLSKALESVNKSIKGTQSGLKDVNKLLKLDPSNTELVVQKQKMLKDAMGANWPYALFTFYRTEAFTDDVLIDWYKSVWEQADRLYLHRTSGNWLIMEMNGLAQTGIFYPQFKQSKLWLDFAFRSLEEELNRQIYPDGFQYELTTTYHEVTVNNYQRVIEAAKAFDVSIPDGLLENLFRACRVYLDLMMPDGRMPNINDGSWADSGRRLEPKLRIFPGVPELIWAASGRKEGICPAYRSVALPYSGFFVMRDGWEANSTWALFDGAPFGRGHQHEDKLSVLVHAGGKLLLTEGGNYAYDDSEMRKYVLSTRSHNTVRVDGGDQNRRKGYVWTDSDIEKKAELAWSIGTEFEYAESTYREGYGDMADRSATHNRCIYFIKHPGYGLQPYFIVADRLATDSMGAEDSGEKNVLHQYEFLWHVDSILENPPASSQEGACQGTRICFKEMDVLISGSAHSIEVICGREEGELQGFISTGSEQGLYCPVNCISALFQGGTIRVVTVLYPHAEERGIAGVNASGNPGDEIISIYLKDGSIITYPVVILHA